MPTHRIFYALVAILACLIAPILHASQTDALESDAKWQGYVFNIEDTKCRVGIAAVRLSVSTLKPKGNYLIGEYTIEVPLMTSRNDKGKIVLPLKNNTVSDLGLKGGVLRGQAISYHEGTAPNHIICKIFPLKNQTILLEITTGDRTLEFKSRYTVSNEVSDR